MPVYVSRLIMLVVKLQVYLLNNKCENYLKTVAAVAATVDSNMEVNENV